MLKAASLAGVAASILLLLAAFTGWGWMWSVLPLIFLVLSSYGFMAGNTMAGALNVDPRRAGSISALMGSASFAAGALASSLTAALGDGSARPVALTMFLAMSGSALVSYLLFEPSFVGELINLGMSDTLAKRAEVQRFFGWPARAPQIDPASLRRGRSAGFAAGA